MIACYPGTFDPITIGHCDIIIRAAKKFDKVVVLIMQNPKKHCMFTPEERKQMIEESISGYHLDNVEVMIGSGLTVKYAKKIGADALIRGIRAVSDYEYELQQATANLHLEEDIETLFFIAKPEYSFISSSTIKEIAANDGDVSGYVPEVIRKRLMEAVKK